MHETSSAARPRVALFFGSFNPIHTGHLIIAQHLLNSTSIDSVYLVVSPHNPFKEKHELLDMHARLRMVQLATQDNARLHACDIEFSLPQPSYTSHTLAHFRHAHENIDFVLLMGSDLLASLDAWKNAQDIRAHHEIYVYARAAHTPDEKTLQNPRIHLLADAPRIDISASLVRARLHAKKSIRYLVPDCVAHYIADKGYYQISN